MNRSPKGWIETRLGSISSIEMGQAPAGSASNFEGRGTPFVKAGEFGKIRPIIREWTTSPLKFGKSSDIFICVVGATAGKINLGTDCSIGRSVAAISPSKGVSQKFIYYQILPRVLELRAKSNGSAQGVLTKKDLSNLEIRIPSLKVQTRIVEKLEELLSQLDAGTAELKTAQRKLELYRQSLLKAAVEGSLTADWRKKNKPAESGEQLLERILTERRQRWEAQQLARFEALGKKPPKDWQKKYPEPVKPDTADLPELPEGWTWASVDQVGKVQLGRQRAPKYHSGTNMVPYLRVANVFEDRIDISDVMEMHFSKEEEESYKLSYNDILLNEGQSLELVGRPAIYRNELKRACFTNTLIRYRTEHGLFPEFALTAFRHYMHSGRFQKIAKITTNIAHLGAGRLAEVELPVPSTDEQRVIVERLEEAFSMTKVIEENIKQLLHQLEAQRQNILRAAFAGELVPQDSNDEPASELLARIQADRDAQTSGKSGRAGRKTGASATARKPRARKPKEEP